MTMISFRVPAVPVSQPAKQFRIVAVAGRKPFGKATTPDRHPVNAFKAIVARAAEDAYSGPPLSGPLWVSVVFVFPRRGKPAWITRAAYIDWFDAFKRGERVPHSVKKHDRDNLLKSLQDPLNGIVWEDDGQIVAGPVEKWVAASDEQAHVEVEVRTLASILGLVQAETRP